METKTYFTSGDPDKTETKKGAVVVSSFAYSYDSVGRKATETLANGQILYYFYDDAGQLTSETRPSAGSNWYGINYTYDSAGNRLTKQSILNGVVGAPEAYTYDNANKLLTAGAKSYTYDAAGNTKTVTGGSQVTTLSWDAAGRLTGIVYPNATTNAFTYNGLGQRVGKTDSTGTFAYTLTDDGIDSAVLSDGAAVYRQAFGMVGEVRGASKNYYNSDSLGSTRTVANNSGVATATRESDAFGNVWAPGTTGTTATPFGFAGQHGYQTDADSGLMRLGHRYYDASTGRFLSRDPIQDGYNWYAYCENDPVNAVDPEGLDSRFWGNVGKIGMIMLDWWGSITRGPDPVPPPVNPPSITNPSGPASPGPGGGPGGPGGPGGGPGGGGIIRAGGVIMEMIKRRISAYPIIYIDLGPSGFDENGDWVPWGGGNGSGAGQII